MKKLLVILSASLLVNPIEAKIDWRDAQDLGYVGGAVAAASISTWIASCYWHPAAAKRAQIEAAQEDKRTKIQKEEAERARQEVAEKERTKASIAFAKLRQDYSQEISALHDSNSLSKEKLAHIVKSKQAIYSSRFKDYYETLTANINQLHTIGVLLSDEEKKAQVSLLTKLEEIKHIFNLKLNEDINFELEEARRVKRHEESERRRVEREELELQARRGEVEAQKNIKKIAETTNAISQKLDSIEQRQITAQRNHELDSASLRKHFNTLADIFRDTVGQARAQLAALFIQRFDDAKKEVISAQSQAAPHVIVNQVPPPYNPAAVSAMSQPAPSEAVDAMPLPTPPPSFR